MRLPNASHTARPWRIHDELDGFRLEDVWRLPTPGGPDDFPLVVERMLPDGRPDGGDSRAARLLWALRWKLGEVFGWDDEDGGELFTMRYVEEHEAAADIVNRTVHGVMHMGWVPDDAAGGGWHAEMAVYVKPNGRLGELYMLAIKPFRYLVVYPALMREIGAQWRDEVTAPRRAAALRA